MENETSGIDNETHKMGQSEKLEWIECKEWKNGSSGKRIGNEMEQLENGNLGNGDNRLRPSKSLSKEVFEQCV